MRYIAGELYRGSHRSRGPQKAGAREQLAVYSRGGFAEEGRQRKRRRGEEGRKDGRKLRNLTTPHRVVGIIKKTTK